DWFDVWPYKAASVEHHRHHCEAIFQSILLEALGVAGSLYSFGAALSGLLNGPYCKGLTWGRPFKGQGGGFLLDHSRVE
ncbi:hypothetical protein AOLI_G00330490, partial [Acnodon oligacanthus]